MLPGVPLPRVGEEDQPLTSQAQKLPCAHLYHFGAALAPMRITIRFASTHTAVALYTEMQLLPCCKSPYV